MERAVFFPNHTEAGCSDSWQKPLSGCLRCRALKMDLDRMVEETALRMVRARMKEIEVEVKLQMLHAQQVKSPP